MCISYFSRNFKNYFQKSVSHNNEIFLEYITRIMKKGIHKDTGYTKSLKKYLSVELQKKDWKKPVTHNLGLYVRSLLPSFATKNNNFPQLSCYLQRKCILHKESHNNCYTIPKLHFIYDYVKGETLKGIS